MRSELLTTLKPILNCCPNRDAHPFA